MRRKKTQNTGQLSLLEYIANDEENRDFIRGLRSMKDTTELWRGMCAVPPGTLIEEILTAFEKGTDIPLELPFFSFLHLLSGELLQREVSLDIEGNKVFSNLWTVLLAPSGSGKSFSFNKIAETANENIYIDMAGCVSSASFIDLLAENNNKLLVRDEYNELYKKLNVDGPLAEVRDYLLRIYDGKKIERKTKKYEVSINEPRISFLGMTVASSFLKCLSDDDMLNGFAQRFSYVFAEKDPKRPLRNFPILKVDNKAWVSRWKELCDSIKYKTYRGSEKGIEAYVKTFQFLCDEEAPDSFIRRIMWSAHKYALVYHILTGQGDREEIGAQSYGWSARVLHLHMIDFKKILHGQGLSEIESLIQKAEALKARCIEKNEAFTVRKMVQNIRGIRNIKQAESLLFFIK